MTYSEFQVLLVKHLQASITDATLAGEKATNEKEQGIYHGVIFQARKTLNLVRDLGVIDNRIALDPSELDTIIRSIDDDKLRRKLQSLKR